MSHSSFLVTRQSPMAGCQRVLEKRGREEQGSTTPVRNTFPRTVGASPAAERVTSVAHASLAGSQGQAGFSSPSPSRIVGTRIMMPRTPIRRLKRRPQKPHFPVGPVALQENTIKISFPEGMLRHISVKGMYRVERGLKEICIQQPQQKMSCGAGAALMFLTHFMQLDAGISLKKTFGRWYVTGTLLDVADIVSGLKAHTNLTDLGYEVLANFYQYDHITEDFHKENQGLDVRYIGFKDYEEFLSDADILCHFKDLQEKTRSPLIVSITNHQLGGHWIIIDKILDKHVLIRDPFKGEHYRLTHDQMLDNWCASPDQSWGGSDEVKVIYLRKV